MRYHGGGHRFEPEAAIRRPRVLLVPNAYVPNHCWELLGRDSRRLWPHGYGVVRLASGRTAPAHRWAWAEVNGAIPAGIQIHHKCFNKLCINPDHLDAVTAGENARLSNFEQRSITRAAA